MKLRNIVALVALMLTFVIAAPTPTYAAWNGVIMAGRVLRDTGNTTGGQTSWCRAGAYGRVDGNLVLFVANHCRNTEARFGPAYTNNHQQIGWWAGPGAWEDNDVTYITLDTSSPYYPTSGRNKIYRGDYNNNLITDSADYWLMTSQPGQFDGCDGFPAGGSYPDTTYHMWQLSMATSYDYRSGHVTGLAFEGTDACSVFTDMGWHAVNGCCDSGTPVIRYSDTTTLNGLVTGWNDRYSNAEVDEGTKSNTGTNGERALYFNPFYPGLEDIKFFFPGSKLCIDDNC